MKRIEISTMVEISADQNTITINGDTRFGFASGKDLCSACDLKVLQACHEFPCSRSVRADGCQGVFKKINNNK